jgi:hypothetical protein
MSDIPVSALVQTLKWTDKEEQEFDSAGMSYGLDEVALPFTYACL